MSAGIKKIFSEVPQRYELINCVITLGQDRIWRRHAARKAAATGGNQWIDMCTGTGNMALHLLRLAPDGVHIYAVDFCAPMMNKAQSKRGASSIQFVEADACSLPFEDDTFDLVIISFATRNINVTEYHLRGCLSEFLRILKPGGRFFNLETSQPVSLFIRSLFHLYVNSYVRVIGSLLSSSPSAYRYLSYTIPRFYTAEALRDLLVEVGFSNVRFERMFMGVVALHEATK